MSKPFQSIPQGNYAVVIADTAVIATGGSTDAEKPEYVVIMLEVGSDPDRPTTRVLYQADPEQARVIAGQLVQRANELESRST